jgi:hypothetical protein
MDFHPLSLAMDGAKRDRLGIFEYVETHAFVIHQNTSLIIRYFCSLRFGDVSED